MVIKNYLIIFVFEFAILLCSCSSKVLLKKEVFDKVELGMTVKQVKELLGEPDVIWTDAVDSTVTYVYYIHNDIIGEKHALVKFDKKGYVNFKLYGVPS